GIGRRTQPGEQSERTRVGGNRGRRIIRRGNRASRARHRRAQRNNQQRYEQRHRNLRPRRALAHLPPPKPDPRFPSVLGRLRDWLLGGPKNLLDPRIHHNLALIAFFAWVGLGSDGLSSSCYGPEEAYLTLGHHTHLAVYLMVATVTTVFLIS